MYILYSTAGSWNSKGVTFSLDNALQLRRLAMLF